VQAKQPSRQFLDLVPKLLSENKWFDCSMERIMNKVHARERIDLRGLHELEDVNGEKVTLSIRLKISGIPEAPEGWDIAFFVNNVRVDGFGYDERFYDSDGVERNGWHRHIWDDKAQVLRRAPVTLFDRDGLMFWDFIVWALKEMKISYPKDDDYATDLFRN
jgi:hypothetical protein